jgi:hypothetical protein
MPWQAANSSLVCLSQPVGRSDQFPPQAIETCSHRCAPGTAHAGRVTPPRVSSFFVQSTHGSTGSFEVVYPATRVAARPTSGETTMRHCCRGFRLALPSAARIMCMPSRPCRETSVRWATWRSRRSKAFNLVHYWRNEGGWSARGRRKLQAPPDANVAPLGGYMLLVLNGLGAPSHPELLESTHGLRRRGPRETVSGVRRAGCR